MKHISMPLEEYEAEKLELVESSVKTAKLDEFNRTVRFMFDLLAKPDDYVEKNLKVPEDLPEAIRIRIEAFLKMRKTLKEKGINTKEYLGGF